MEVLELYSKLIIEPLEREIKNLKIKINNKKISFTRDIEKKYLKKLEKLLFFYYGKLSLLINKEFE